MRRSVLVAAMLVLALPLAGCLRDGPSPEVQEKLDEWEADRDAHGPTGLEASFELSGRPLHVTGNLTAERLPAPVDLDVHPVFPSDEPYVYFRQADVGTFGTGLLVVEGRQVRIDRGRLADVGLAEVRADGTVRLAPRTDNLQDVPERRYPPTWDSANESAFFATFVDADLPSVRITGHDRAVLIRADNSSQELVGPVTFSAAGFWWDDASRINASSASIDAAAFTAGGNVSSGRVQGELQVASPDAVFGHDGRIDVGPDRVASNGTLRLTQVLTDDGPRIGSQVELLTEEDTVTVDEGNATWVRVHYREASFEGDAVIEDVRVTGDGASMVTVPIERPPTAVEELWQAVRNASWAAPFAVIGAVFLTPGLLFFEALDCILFDCPEQQPYPAWMEAGDIGRFYYRVNATMAPGTYDATIRILGQNYDAVAFPVTIRVSEASGT